jgi:YVTN family beta-propeller protein
MIRLTKKTVFFILLLTIILFVIGRSPKINALESPNAIVVNPNTNMIYLSNDNKTVSVIDGKTNKIIATIPSGKQQETSFDIGNITDKMAAGGTIAAIVTALIGIRTYKQSQVLKNKDVLKDIIYPLVEEFDNRSKFGIAKDLLDDKSVKFETNEKDPANDYPNRVYLKNKLDVILRDHNKRRINTIGEEKIREAFDHFLDFLVKLEYLVNIELVSMEQISYFKYFIDIAAENKGVKNYVRIYKFPLFGKLHLSLDCRLDVIN